MSIRVVERNCGDIARKILAISEATGKDKLNEAIGRGIVLPPLDERAHLMEQSALGGVRTEEAAGCKVDRSYTLRNHFTDSFDLTWYLSASSFLLSRMYKDEPLLKTYRE